MGRLANAVKPELGDRPEWWSTDEWETPPEEVKKIEARLGITFDLDPCCRPETAKAPKYYTKVDNGLAQPWAGWVWVNPPYSEPKKWIEKAIAETQRDPSCHVVMLLPAAVDTGWFHDLVVPNADVQFIRGRILFWGWARSPIGSPTSGSVLAIFPRRVG